MENRDLLDEEKEMIGKMNLSSKQEEKVRSVWRKEEFDRGKWYLSPLFILLELIVTATFVANLLAPNSFTASAVNLAMFITWIYAIIFVFVAVLLVVTVLGNPLGHTAMNLTRKAGTVRVFLTRMLLVSYIVATVLDGHLITAFVLVTAILISLVLVFAAKEEVKEELKKIDSDT